MLGIMMRSRVGLELMVKPWRCSCSPICLQSGSAHPYAIYTSIFIRLGTYTTIYACMSADICIAQCLGIQYTCRLDQYAHKCIFLHNIRRLISYSYYIRLIYSGISISVSVSVTVSVLVSVSMAWLTTPPPFAYRLISSISHIKAKFHLKFHGCILT